MIVYNITNKVSPEIEQRWVEWMKNEHIPEVMATGKFTSSEFYRLLDQDESEGVTYIVQYFAASIEDYQEYIDKMASALRKKTIDKWNNQFIAFRTVMRVVD